MEIGTLTLPSTSSLRRRRAAPPVWIAPLLLCSALLAFVFVVIPARSTLASLNHTRQSVEAYAPPTERDAAVPVLAKADPYRLKAFREYLSSGDLESDWVVMIHAMANQLGLPLNEIRYIHAPSVLEGFREVRVQTTLRGPYEAIQSYVDALLGRIPVLAIDRLVLNNSGSTPGQIEASLEMTLFMGNNR